MSDEGAGKRALKREREGRELPRRVQEVAAAAANGLLLWFLHCDGQGRAGTISSCLKQLARLRASLQQLSTEQEIPTEITETIVQRSHNGSPPR